MAVAVLAAGPLNPDNRAKAQIANTVAVAPLGGNPALQRTATCSLMYRSATSAGVGPAAVPGTEPFRAGSCPALMLAITIAALRRACSADTSPCRPMVIRLDFPPALVWTT